MLYSLISLIIILNIIFTKLFSNIVCLPRLMLSYWTANILMGLIFIKNYEWKYWGLLFIILLCGVCGVGFYLTKYLLNKYNNNMTITNDFGIACYKYDGIRNLLKISIFLGILYSCVNLYFLNISFEELFSYKTLLLINEKNAFLRYHNLEYKNTLYQILLIFVFLAPMIGGCFYVKNEKYLSFFSFLPAFLVLLLQNTKTTLIIALVLWISSFLITYYEENNKYFEITKTKIIYSLLFFIIFVIILLCSMLLRAGGFNEIAYYTVLTKFTSYAFGHMVAFDSWFSEINLISLKYGSMTFLGISNFIGIEERNSGIFLDYVYTEHLRTNVYTSFRSLIMDFGLIYSLFIFFILGIYAKYFEIYLINSKNYFVKSLGIVSMIAIYSYILFSSFASIFSYTSIVCAFILSIFIIIFERGYYGKI